MEAAPSAQATALAALAARCQGSVVLRKLDNTTRFLAGTATKLYEAAATSWTDRTRVAGDYNLGTDIRWRFGMFSDTSIAAAKSEIIQTGTTGAFANAAANAPKVADVETVNGFVIAIDVNDQGGIFDSADRPHGWWAVRTLTTWTPSVANEAYTGSLTSTSGKNRAIKRFGQAAIIYKDRSMYQLTYIGQSGWEASLIPGEAGAMSKEVVVDVGTTENPVHIFMGFEDFYLFDGSKPISIGTPLSRTVFQELNKSYSHLATALHDRINKRILFYYPVSGTTNPDKCVVYNYRTGKWGRDDRTIEASVEYISAGLTWDDLGASYSTWHDLPDVSYDSSFWVSGFPLPAVFNSSHMVQTLNGTPTSSSMTTGDYGSDDVICLQSRVQPSFLTKPTSGAMTNYYKDSLGGSLTQDQTVNMGSKGRFDSLRSACWHREAFEFAGSMEFDAIRFEMQPDGDE